MHSGYFVGFGTLGPSKVGARCINDADKQGQDSKSDTGFIIVSLEYLIGSDTQKSSNARQNNDWQINLGSANGLEFFGAFMTPGQASCLFAKVCKENLEAFRPCNIVVELSTHFVSTQV